MKIKAHQIKPGMVIARKLVDKWDDISLVAAVISKNPIEIVHFDYIDGYIGAMVMTIVDENEVVKVINGKKRARVIQSILDDVFKLKHDAEQYINTIRLIKEMENGWK